MEDYWKKKYLQYKNKYLQEAGKIVFDDCAKYTDRCNSPRLLIGTENGQKKILNTNSMQFTKLQEITINYFTNSILQKKINYNGKPIENIAEGIHVIGAGSYGSTISINDLLIKIIKIENVQLIQQVVDEAKIQIRITREQQRNGMQIMPPFFGVVTTNQTFSSLLLQSLHNEINYEPRVGNLFDIIIEPNTKVSYNQNNIIDPISEVDGNMIFILQEKMTMDAFSYFERNIDDDQKNNNLMEFNFRYDYGINNHS